MNFDEIMKNQDVIAMLHDVLENESTKKKISPISPRGETYRYNQYSMSVIMDSLIKYTIVIEDTDLFFSYLKELKRMSKSYSNHNELILWCHELLGEMIRIKLGLSEKSSVESKKRILKYLYDRYITHGYLFHSFPSSMKEVVEEDGIVPMDLSVQERKKNYYIFKNHRYPDILPTDFKNPPYILLTDSPLMAFYHTFSGPSYFSNLVAGNKYMKNEEKYDREAYYRRDQEACFHNMKTLCEHVRMTEKEQKNILDSFFRQWEMTGSSSSPCIAFIERKELSKDKLKDIDSILEESSKEKLIVSIFRIMNSRFTSIKRYHDILPLSFVVRRMPSYKEIKENQLQKKERKPIKEEPQEKINIRVQPSFSYGYASVIGLFGVFLISLGFTILIIFHSLGIGGL